MARPSGSNSAQTSAQILEAAARLLFQGPRLDVELSLRRVAVEAGLSLGTVQYYFSSREALLEACMSPYYDRLDALARTLAEQALTLSPADRPPFVRHAATALYDFASGERHFLQLRSLINASHGGLPQLPSSRVRDAYLVEFGELLAPVLNLPPLQARLLIQTLNFLIMQYALLEPDQARTIVGRAEPDPAEALRAHLGDLAVSLLLSASAKQP